MKKNKLTMQELDVLLNRNFLDYASNPSLANDLQNELAKHTLANKTTLKSRMTGGTIILCVSLIIMAIYFSREKTSSGFQSVNRIAKPSSAQISVQKKIENARPQSIPSSTDVVVCTKSGKNNNSNTFKPVIDRRNDTLLINETICIKSDTALSICQQTQHSSFDTDGFPRLTEKEIKKNEKEKRTILKIASHVAKDRTGSVVKVPDSPDGTIKNFYLEGGEVTNREYRVFLFDLLINGRKEEFLRAKPQQEQWKNVEGQSTFDYLAVEYFSDRKYDYYPVVNISLEGAEMYCQWIKNEVDKLRLNDGKVNVIEVRLPYENEWLYAASAGRANAIYPWPIDSIQNKSNCFMANFCAQKLKNEFRYPINYGKHQIDLTCYTTVGVFMRKHELATIEVWSYNPNAFGLFCMSGNVSELVYKNDHSGIKTMGGNWASDYKHLRLDSEDEFENHIVPSPKIGFRVCIILK
jgi:formylglycine-generating enzyme required for sulfatase activity